MLTWSSAGGSHGSGLGTFWRCSCSGFSVTRREEMAPWEPWWPAVPGRPPAESLPGIWAEPGVWCGSGKTGDPPSCRSFPGECERTARLFKLCLTELPNAALLTPWLAGRKRDWGVWIWNAELIVLHLRKNCLVRELLRYGKVKTKISYKVGA